MSVQHLVGRLGLCLIAGFCLWGGLYGGQEKFSLGEVSGPSAVTAEKVGDWELVTEKAEWAARDSAGEVVFRDRMWVLGGWFQSFEDPPRDVWSSSDGVKWDKATGAAGFLHGDLPTSLVFDDRMWMMGGWHGGRLPHASASRQVWSSADGAQWRQVTANAPWDARMAAGGEVFENKMWILGGVRKYYFGTDADLLHDVWSSADGVNWTKVTDKAAWSPRAYPATVVFRGRIWVLGGGNYLPNYAAHNDVWSSANGRDWERVVEHAPWAPRIWFSAAVYRDRLWVLGGWKGPNAKGKDSNWDDVWYSEDGAVWHRFVSATPLPARHEHSVFVFQDALWVAGGMGPPLLRDVWRLKLPAKPQ